MPDLENNYFDFNEAFQKFDANFQIGPQKVDALIPINPARCPGHAIATSFSDNIRGNEETLLRPIENFEVMLEYLSSSQSDAHYNSRFGQVCHDTSIVNALAEMGGSIGQMLAGDYANQAADQYMQQIIEDEWSPIDDDQIARSFRVRLRGGPGSKYSFEKHNVTHPMFNGVGLFKEGLEADKRSNPFKALPTCRRSQDRSIWTYKFFQQRGGAFIPVRSFYSYQLLRVINYYARSNALYMEKLKYWGNRSKKIKIQ